MLCRKPQRQVFSCRGPYDSLRDNSTNTKCSKISKTFLFLFPHKMLVIRAGNYIMLVRIANREDPYQTASELVLVCAVCPRTFW